MTEGQQIEKTSEQGKWPQYKLEVVAMLVQSWLEASGANSMSMCNHMPADRVSCDTPYAAKQSGGWNNYNSFPNR